MNGKETELHKDSRPGVGSMLRLRCCSGVLLLVAWAAALAGASAQPVPPTTGFYIEGLCRIFSYGMTGEALDAEPRTFAFDLAMSPETSLLRERKVAGRSLGNDRFLEVTETTLFCDGNLAFFLSRDPRDPNRWGATIRAGCHEYPRWGGGNHEIIWMAYASARYLDTTKTDVPFPISVVAQRSEPVVLTASLERFQEPPYLLERYTIAAAPSPHEKRQVRDLEAVGAANHLSRVGQYTVLATTNVGGLVLPLRSEFQVIEPDGRSGRFVVRQLVELSVSRADRLDQAPERPVIEGIVTVGDIREYAEVRDGVRYELTNAYVVSLDDPIYLEAKSNTMRMVAIYDQAERRQQGSRRSVGWPVIAFVMVLLAGPVVAWAWRRG
jgi:hypothetical protein